MFREIDRANVDAFYFRVLATQIAAGENREVTQGRAGERLATLVRRVCFRAGCEYLNACRNTDGYFIIRCLVEDKVAYGRFEFAAPLVAVVNGENGITGAEQHHSAAFEVDVAGAPRLAIAAHRGADLLNDVRSQSRFVAIDLRYAAFELDDDFGRVAWRNWFAKIDSQCCALIVERRKQRRAVEPGADFDDVQSRLVDVGSARIVCRGLLARAEVGIQVKVDYLAWFLAAIDPANAFDAGVRTLVEVDLEVDFGGVYCLRIRCVNRYQDKHEQD